MWCLRNPHSFFFHRTVLPTTLSLQHVNSLKKGVKCCAAGVQEERGPGLCRELLPQHQPVQLPRSPREQPSEDGGTQIQGLLCIHQLPFNRVITLRDNCKLRKDGHPYTDVILRSSGDAKHVLTHCSGLLQCNAFSC